MRKEMVSSVLGGQNTFPSKKIKKIRKVIEIAQIFRNVIKIIIKK